MTVGQSDSRFSMNPIQYSVVKSTVCSDRIYDRYMIPNIIFRVSGLLYCTLVLAIIRLGAKRPDSVRDAD